MGKVQCPQIQARSVRVARGTLGGTLHQPGERTGPGLWGSSGMTRRWSTRKLLGTWGTAEREKGTVSRWNAKRLEYLGGGESEMLLLDIAVF